MDGGQNAENEDGRRLSTTAPDDPGTILTAASREDCLRYIADLVHELKIMSARAGCQRLAALLDMAECEARRLQCHARVSSRPGAPTCQPLP